MTVKALGGGRTKESKERLSPSGATLLAVSTIRHMSIATRVSGCRVCSARRLVKPFVATCSIALTCFITGCTLL